MPGVRNKDFVSKAWIEFSINMENINREKIPQIGDGIRGEREYEAEKASIEASVSNQITSLLKIIKSQGDEMLKALTGEAEKEPKDQNYKRILESSGNLSKSYKKTIESIKDFKEKKIEAVKPPEIKIDDLKNQLENQIEQKRSRIVETQILIGSSVFSELCSYAESLGKEIELSLYGYNGEQYNPEILLEDLKEVNEIFSELAKEASMPYLPQSASESLKSTVAEALFNCEKRLNEFLIKRVDHFAETFDQRVSSKGMSSESEVSYLLSDEANNDESDQLRFKEKYLAELPKRRENSSLWEHSSKESVEDRKLDYGTSLERRINSLSEKKESLENATGESKVATERQRQKKIQDIINEIKYNCHGLHPFDDPLEPDSFRPEKIR